MIQNFFESALQAAQIAQVAAQIAKSISQSPDLASWQKIAESIAEATGSKTADASGFDASNLSDVTSLASNIVDARRYIQDQMSASPELKAAVAAAGDSLTKLRALPDGVDAARGQMNDLAAKLQGVQRLLANAPAAAGNLVAKKIAESLFMVVLSVLANSLLFHLLGPVLLILAVLILPDLMMLSML